MLVRKLERCGQGFRPIFHMMPYLYASGAFALRENNDFLHSTHKGYRNLINKAKCKPEHEDDTQEICFAIGQAARKVHACRRKYRIPLSMKEEIESLRKLLQADNVPLVTSIGHIIPRDHAWEQAAATCTSSGGGWSVDLTFWWHLVFQKKFLKELCFKTIRKEN